MYIFFLTDSYEEADTHLKDHYNSSDLEVSSVLGPGSATATGKSKRPRKPKEVFDPSTTIQKRSNNNKRKADNCLEGEITQTKTLL